MSPKIIVLDRRGKPMRWIPGQYELQHLFHPGERVSGSVSLELEKEVEIQAVSIRFRGKCTAVIPDGEDSRMHSFFMFDFEKTLFKGPFKLKAETHLWPFSFHFPDTFDTDLGDKTPGGKYTIGRQILPPSLLADKTDCVTYKLRARVQRGFSDLESRINLKLSPFRLEAMPLPKMISRNQNKENFHHRYRYTEDKVPRSLTSKESFVSKFWKSPEIQTFQFSIIATVPTHIIMGEQYPIHIKLYSPAIEMAPLDFRLCSIRSALVAKTHVRVPTAKEDFERTVKEKIHFFSRNGIDMALEPNMPMVVDGLFPTAVKAPPSFSSPIICREYGMNLYIRFTCLDKVYESVCKFPTVVLYPARMEDGVQEAIEDISLQTEESVPAYEPRSEDLPRYC